MGGMDIGYGHLFRCISLAKAIRKESSDYKIYFIVNEDIKNIVDSNGFEYIESSHFEKDYKIINEMCFDLVVFDSYRANDSYLRRIKNITKLMLFDDNNDIYDSSIPDIVLNGNIHANDLDYKTDSSTQFLLGLNYLVMHEGYWDDESTDTTVKRGILVTTGGSDIYNISPKILKELVKTEFDVTVIVGPGYLDETIDELYKIKNCATKIILRPNGLKNYIKCSEYVISASGSTVYETLSQKSIPIIFSLADNQEIAYEYFKGFGVYSIGKYPDINFKGINQILNQPTKVYVNELYEKIDGKGALRVALQIIRFLSDDGLSN